MANVSKGFVADPDNSQSIPVVYDGRRLSARLYLFDIPETSYMPGAESYNSTHMIASSGSKIFGIVNAVIGPEPGTLNISTPSMTITFGRARGSGMITDENTIKAIISARDQTAHKIREIAELSRK